MCSRADLLTIIDVEFLKPAAIPFWNKTGFSELAADIFHCQFFPGCTGSSAFEFIIGQEANMGFESGNNRSIGPA